MGVFRNVHILGLANFGVMFILFAKISYNKIYSVKKIKRGERLVVHIDMKCWGCYWQEEELSEEGTQNWKNICENITMKFISYMHFKTCTQACLGPCTHTHVSVLIHIHRHTDVNTKVWKYGRHQEGIQEWGMDKYDRQK